MSKTFNMVFLFDKLSEDEELSILDRMLNVVNASVFSYSGPGKCRFRVNMLGKEDRSMELYRPSIKGDFYALAISLNPKEYLNKPSGANVSRLLKKMQRLVKKICIETDCDCAFIDDNLEEINEPKVFKEEKPKHYVEIIRQEDDFEIRKNYKRIRL